MQKVAILGVGLMGGSLGMALRNVMKNKERKYFVLGIGRDANNLKIAKKNGAVDDYSTDIGKIKDSDVVFICYPVDMIVETYKKVSKIVSQKAVITDIGSIKSAVEVKINDLRKKDRSMPLFVGCHPMAGTEKNGIAHAQKDLYKNANVIITNLKDKNISKIWQDIGCNIVYMTADEHDEFTAFTSHLPHIIAFNFYKMFKEKSLKDKRIRNITGGSFNSITRVAKSSPDMWLPIFQGNRKNLIKITDSFCRELKKFIKNLGNKKNLQKILEKSASDENK